MGLADRHYHREPGGFSGMPPGGGSGVMNWRLWSVTTWIIAICTAVFVLDTFLPRVPVTMGTRISNEYLDQPEIVRSATPGPREVGGRDRNGQPTVGVQPLLVTSDDGQSQTIVGVRQLTYMPFLQAHLHFSTQKGFLQIEFWRLIGFQFLHTHDTLMHLLFNMMGLFFFGPLVERELGSKRYLAFYLLCGIAGALLYTILNLGGLSLLELTGGSEPVTFLLFSDMSTPLIGASAGVFGVLIAGARLAPNATVHLFMLIPVRFGTLAWVLIGIEVVMLLTGARNAGGHAAHLGGAAAGFYFIRNPHHLHDFFDILGRADPSSRTRRGLPRGGGGTLTRARQGLARVTGQAAPDPEEVDRILDKVFNHGLSSLTAKEQRILEAARRDGDRRSG
jgi:membrane associated rhomboid family serine protease